MRIVPLGLGTLTLDPEVVECQWKCSNREGEWSLGVEELPRQG